MIFKSINNQLYIMGQISDEEENYQKFLDIIEQLNPEEPLKLTIETDGGNPEFSRFMYHILKERFDKIETYCYSVCSSAGIILYLLGQKRYGFSGCKFLIHSSHIELDKRCTIKNLKGYITDIQNDDTFEKKLLDEKHITYDPEIYKSDNYFIYYDTAKRISLITE